MFKIFLLFVHKKVEKQMNVDHEKGGSGWEDNDGEVILGNLQCKPYTQF